jgi:hypothetical protein
MFYHPITNCLFQQTQSEISFYKPITRQNRTSTPIFVNVQYRVDTDPSFASMTPIDAVFTREGIQLVAPSDINSHNESHNQDTSSLSKRFQALDPALQRLCGHFSFPPDDGITLLRRIQNNGNPLFGSSNASVRHLSFTHAWTITSGDISDLQNPLLCISGHGPTDGCPNSISSTRGELQGQTAMAIISDLFLTHNSSNASISLICDNKGAIQRCSNPPTGNLHHHRQPNMDILLQHHTVKRRRKISYQWVKAHQDTKKWESLDDLISLNLDRDATYNI